MEKTNLSCDALKTICDAYKIDVKNESFEDWKDSSSNELQGYSSLSLAEKKMSSNLQDAELRDEKVPTTSLALKTRPSSNSEVIQPERNDFHHITESLNSQQGEAEYTSFSIREIKTTLGDENNNNVNFTNKIGIVIGHLSEKHSKKSKQRTDKASGKSRKTSNKEKTKNKKSHSLHLSSKVRNEETHGAKHKLASVITEKNQEGCNIPVSSCDQKVRFDSWEEASCSRETRARKVHVSYDINASMGTYLSNIKSSDKKSKYPSKKDYCKAYSSDQSNSIKKNYYCEASKTFNLSHKEEAREYKQYIPHSEKISSVEENNSEMKETFSYNSTSCLEKPSVINDKNLSQKTNLEYNDKLNHASCTDNEVVISCNIYKLKSKTVLNDIRGVSTSNMENIEEKSKNDCGDLREVRTSNTENGEEKSKNECGNIREVSASTVENREEKSKNECGDIEEVSTSNKGNGEEKSKNECGDIRKDSTSNKTNKGKISGSTSPLTVDIKMTNDYGKKDEVVHVNDQQVLLMPLNNNNFENIETEETTGVERAQTEEVVILSDTQRKNINETPSKEVLETSNTKEKENLGNEEFVDSSRPRFDLRNERPKSVEIINVEEDQLEECYSCPRCNFTTTNKVSLNQHFYTHLNANLSRNSHDDMHRIIRNPIRHHPGKQSSMKSLELECCFCGYTCMRKKKLEKHVFENHFSKKVYKCYACSDEFSDMSLLRRHSGTHLENDPLLAANFRRCPCDNLLQHREMGSHKRPFSGEEENRKRYKRGKFDNPQDGKLENIMIGLDKLMNKMNVNITLFRQAIITQANELGAVMSCLKTNMNTTLDTSGLRDSPTIQSSTSKRQQMPNSRYNCVNCEPQPSTSDNTFQNINDFEREIFSYDSSSTN